MIKRGHITRLWKRTIVAIIIVDLVALGILVSFVAKRASGSETPTTATIILLFGAVILASTALYYIARFVRNRIEDIFGED